MGNPSWHTVKLPWEHWEIVDQLGRGSFSKVYSVVKKESGVTYEAAVKHISIPKDEDELYDGKNKGYYSTIAQAESYYKESYTRLQTEITLMYDLQGYSHIVNYQAHETIKKDDMPGYDVFIRMEKLKPLNQVWAEKGGLNRSDVIKVGLDMCDALKIVHEKNILHRDIKVENVFYKNGEYKLGDFGVSRILNHTDKVTTAGTPSYMAPEVYRYEGVNHTADIYSLGIMLYRLLNGNRAPFLPADSRVTITADLDAEAFDRRMTGEPLPVLPNVDERLMRVILKACDFHAINRYQSAGEMERALRGCLAGEPVPPETPYHGRSNETVIIPPNQPEIERKTAEERKREAAEEAERKAKEAAERREKQEAERQRKQAEKDKKKAEREEKIKAARQVQKENKAAREAAAKAKKEEREKAKADQQRTKAKTAVPKGKADAGDWPDPGEAPNTAYVTSYWGLDGNDIGKQADQPSTGWDVPDVVVPKKKKAPKWGIPLAIAGAAVLVALVLILALGGQPKADRPVLEYEILEDNTILLTWNACSQAVHYEVSGGSLAEGSGLTLLQETTRHSYLSREFSQAYAAEYQVTAVDAADNRTPSDVVVVYLKGNEATEAASAEPVSAATNTPEPATAPPTNTPDAERPTASPQATIMSYAQYMAAPAGDTVCVVAFVQSKCWSYSEYDHCPIYAQDADGGYRIIDAACTAAEYDALEIGAKIRVEGTKQTSIKDGAYIANATITVLSGNQLMEAQDITAQLDGDLSGLLHQRVVIRNAKVEWAQGYSYSLSSGGHQITGYYEATRRPVQSENTVSSVMQAGNLVDVEGFLCWDYGAKLELTEVKLVEPAPSAECAHQMDWQVQTAATCNQAGMDVEICRYCGKTGATRSVPPTGVHNYVETVKAATCKAEGSIISRCSGCGDIKVELLDKLPHTYVVDEAASKEPSCGEAGERKSKCTGCGAMYNEMLPATGNHSYGPWENYNGTMQKHTCTVCGHVEDRER